MHTLLRVDAVGDLEFEPVHVEPVAEGVVRVIHSPGLVYGVAAGDEIKLLAAGGFEVVKRAGNLAVRVLAEQPIREVGAALIPQVNAELGGRLDGELTNAFVFTISAMVGFPAVERLFTRFASEQPGVVWEFGNVYDSSGSPLNWWNLPSPVND